MNNNVNEIRNLLTKTLPPIIARSKVEELTGGLVKRSTLSTYDSRGKGIPNPIKFTSIDGARGKVCYRRDDLIDWIVSRIDVDDNSQQQSMAA